MEDEAENDVDRLTVRLQELGLRIHGTSLCRCYSRVWFECDEAPCDTASFRSEIERLASKASERQATTIRDVLLPR